MRVVVVSSLFLVVGGGWLAGCTSAAPRPEIAPGVIATFPIDAQLDVPISAPVRVTFSDPIDAGALGPCSASGGAVNGALCVVGPDGPVDGTAQVLDDGRTVLLDGLALAPGTRYQVYVRPALEPAAENLPAATPLFAFTTASTAPRVLRPTLVAVDGAPPTSPDAFRPTLETSTLRLVFSEPLDPRTVTLAPGAIALVDPSSGDLVPATLLAGGVHVSIDPIHDLIPDHPYLLEIGDAVTDLAGQAITPVTIPITPRRSLTGPPIAEMLRTRQPGDPGPALPTGAARNQIAITSPLIGASTSQLQPGVLAAELGDPTALDGPIAFTLRRGQRLSASGLAVALGGELATGLATGTIQIELLSDAGGRLYRNPYRAADQLPDGQRAPLYVDLSMDLAVYAIDPAGNATLTQTLLGVQASGTAVITHGVIDLQAQLAMDLDLLGVTHAPARMTLELITDPAATIDADHTAPTVVSSSVDPPLDELAIDDGVEVVFSEPIDLDRARASGVVLERSDGQVIASEIESHGAAIVIRPLAPLADATGYRVEIADVTDVAGNPLAAPRALAFTTPPRKATDVPLSVTAVHPGAPCSLVGATATSPGRCAGGAAGDDLYHPFELAADRPITVTLTQAPRATSVALGPLCGGGAVRVEALDDHGACLAPVDGTLLSHGRQLTFVPDHPWQVGARYRLTLASGPDASCAAGELCSRDGVAASFDPLAGTTHAAAGGPDLVIDFTGAPPDRATLATTATLPVTDVNGSGLVDATEVARADNRVAMQVVGVTGGVTSASFSGPDCVPATPAHDGCMYLSGSMPVELLAPAHDCVLPGGEIVATCVPVALSAQAMYGTSVPMKATAVSGNSTINIDTATAEFVMRIREPADGPPTGYLIDDGGVPTLVVALDLYLDAPDLLTGLLTNDVHSKPLHVILRGPMRFLPDGRIAIATLNTEDLPVAVDLSGGVTGSIKLLIPRGAMALQLVSPLLRGGQP